MNLSQEGFKGTNEEITVAYITKALSCHIHKTDASNRIKSYIIQIESLLFFQLF